MTLTDPANRVRWWIGLALSAVLVGAIAAPVIAIVLMRERNATTAADEIVVRIGARTSDLVTGELVKATQSLELLGLLVEMGEEATIDHTLAAQMHAAPHLSGAFVGFPDGSFRFVRVEGDALVLKRVDVSPDRLVTEARLSPELEPTSTETIEGDAYDPRVRPWFTAATASDGVVWTDPYVFFSSGQPGVTAARAIRSDDGSVTAVVGVDVALSQMAAFLDDLPIDETAEAFILSDDTVVAAPSRYDVAATDDDGELTLAGLSQIGVTSRELTTAAGNPEPVAVADGGRLFALGLDDPGLPTWTVAVRTGEIEFVDVVGHQSRVALVATIVAALALLAAIPLVVVRLRRPIDELSHRARFDPLTELPNRATLVAAGRSVVQRAYKTGDEVTLALVDIDDFKTINDRYGHAAGDAAIRRVAGELRGAVRDVDLVGRIGGDEFVVILSGVSRSEAQRMLERVHRAVLRGLGEDETTRRSGITIGMTSLEERALDIERLIAEADGALIDAKRTAKGTIAAN